MMFYWSNSKSLHSLSEQCGQNLYFVTTNLDTNFPHLEHVAWPFFCTWTLKISGKSSQFMKRDIQTICFMVLHLMGLEVFYFMKYHITFWTCNNHSRSSIPHWIIICSICLFVSGSFTTSSKHAWQYHFFPIFIQKWILVQRVQNCFSGSKVISLLTPNF